MDAELAALKAQGMPTTAKELNDFYFVPEDDVGDGMDDSAALYSQELEGPPLLSDVGVSLKKGRGVP
ncbi:MAG: hypothetical protein ACKV0T_16055 [Planctomycetales bacterium]